jgi:hypothetical protein
VEWDRAEVVSRLHYLRSADPGLTRFGSAAHRYLLNPPLAEHAVTAFEARHDVSLPDGYRAFLVQVGDGGAGPFYGVFRLDRSDPAARDREDLLPGFLAAAFPHGRSSDMGITPFLPDFATWYLQWLRDPMPREALQPYGT